MENKELYIRDTIHTTDFGSNYYGANIYDYFIKNIQNKPLIKYEITKNHLCNIIKISYSKKIYNKLTIRGKGTILQIYQLIGRFSSQVKISNININNEQTTQLIDIWDEWAHYDRMMSKIYCLVDNLTIIEVSTKTMNRDSCHNKHVDWSQYPNYLDIRAIYYTGDIYVDESNSY